MEFWEFLIQKEGDRSWLPLESPDVEVLEGRYRVVARTSRLQTPVEIRITHLAIAEEPPKRRVQKRTSKTNPDGLVVVMPFTRLQSGVWELRCTSDLMSDMAGTGWSYAVKLQVLSKEETAEWEPDWQPDQAESAVDEPAFSQNGAVASETVPVQPIALTPEQSVAAEESAEKSMPSSPVEEPAIAVSPVVETTQKPSSEVESVEPENSEQDSEQQNVEPVQAAAISENPPSVHSQSVQTPSVDPVVTFQEAVRSSEEWMSDLVAELEDLAEMGDRPASHSTSQANEVDVAHPTVQIVLEREAWIAQRGQTVAIDGRLNLLSDAVSQADLGTAFLRVRLYDPQSSNVLAEENHALTCSSAPCPFSCSIALPERLQTRLLLGEVVLFVAGQNQTPAPLATQSFSVTVNLDDLLEALANAFVDSEAIQPPLEFIAPSPDRINLSFLELTQQPTETLTFQSSSHPVLPPQIYQPSGDRPVKPIDLPFADRLSSNAGESSSEAPEAAVSANAELADEAIASHPTEEAPEPSLTDVEALPTHQDEGFSGEQPPIDSNISDSSIAAEPMIPFPAIDEPIEFEPAPTLLDQWGAESAPNSGPLSLEELAFQSLNLRNRFWNRLSALASDRELSSWLQGDPLQSLPVSQAPLGIDTDLAAREVVAEDALPPRREATQPQPQRNEKAAARSPFNNLADEAPLPYPQLIVQNGELVSGKPVLITAKIPGDASRIYIKLWIYDPQTRSLLDGPRWLVDLAPDGYGNLEAATQMTVPFGCLTIQFEAIAVEMTTQRESHKVIVERQVIPPNVPSLTVEELDVF